MFGHVVKFALGMLKSDVFKKNLMKISIFHGLLPKKLI